MAVDSRLKRGSVPNLATPLRVVLPPPDNAGPLADRVALAFLYPGLQTSSAAAATISDIRDGLVTRLQTISGLRVYSTQMDSIQEYPCAVVILERLDYVMTVAGHSFEGQFRVAVLVNSVLSQDAYTQLDQYLDAGTSAVVGAVYGDDTLGGAVDGLVVTPVRRVYPIPETDLVAADILVTFTKSVT